MVRSTSCPNPGWTAPSLVVTVPAMFPSLASRSEVEPTWVSPRRPMDPHVFGLPDVLAVARLSEVQLDDAHTAEPERTTNRLTARAVLPSRTPQPSFDESTCI